MRRPRLTDKAAAGLAWVEGQAKADLDSTMADENPSLSKGEAECVSAALAYLRGLYVWHFGASKGCQ